MGNKVESVGAVGISEEEQQQAYEEIAKILTGGGLKACVLLYTRDGNEAHVFSAGTQFECFRLLAGPARDHANDLRRDMEAGNEPAPPKSQLN